MKIPKVMEIEWEDHSFTFGEVAHRLASTITVGYFVEETDEAIVLALSIVDGVPHDKQLVDKRMLVRKRVIRRAQS